MSDDSAILSDTLPSLQAKLALLEAENRLLREEAFVLSERLQKADSGSHADFLAAAAHELRTPLTSIKGYVTVMLDGDTGDLSPIQTEFLRTVTDNADRLNSLINQLLEIARIEARRVLFTRDIFPARAVLDDAMETVREACVERRHELDTAIAPDLPQINGDRERLSRALGSLLQHACTVTPDSGRIGVDAFVEGERLTIQIEDSGGGIPQADLPRIFSHFYHPDGDMERGTGLNLAVARAIIEMHNGTLSAKNTPTGTMFRVSLPIATLVLPAVPTPQPVGLSIIATDPRFITLYEEIGRARGYSVRNIAAADAVAANGMVVVNGAETGTAMVGAPVVRLAPLELELLNAGAASILRADATMADIQAAVGEFDTALCISPDALTLRNLDKMLHEGGCGRVLRATMEHDGLMLARRHTPPVIILDARHSGSSAFDTLDSLRADSTTHDIPVVALVEPIALPNAPFATVSGEDLPRPVTRFGLLQAIGKVGSVA